MDLSVLIVGALLWIWTLERMCRLIKDVVLVIRVTPAQQQQSATYPPSYQ
jgi:hypothetical protein